MLKTMEVQQQRLYDRLQAHLKRFVADEIVQLESRMLDRLEQRSAKQAARQQEDLDRQIDALREEVTGLVDDKVYEVDSRVDDEFYGLRLRLEEFVKDEIVEAEARVVEHLENAATVSLHFATS